MPANARRPNARPLAFALLCTAGFALALAAWAGTPPASTPPLSGKAAPLPGPAGRPRLAFLELAPGPEVTREVAQSAGEVLVAAGGRPPPEGKLVRAGKAWKYEHGRDFNCEEVLDAQ